MLLNYTLCWTKWKLLANFSLTVTIMQKLKELGIRSRATTAPRTRWACDFPLLKDFPKDFPNQVLPDFFLPQELVKHPLNAVCNEKRAFEGDSGFSRCWQLESQWVFGSWTGLESLSPYHPMAFLVSQQIFYKDSATIPELLWKRCAKPSLRSWVTWMVK